LSESAGDGAVLYAHVRGGFFLRVLRPFAFSLPMS
jgi:hypothetical protein